MKENKLERLKEIQLEMLKEFIRICEKYDFCYFMLYGSCLGAIRHKGFIPWDDDIDVGMPREDYEKFITVAQEELSEGYFLQNGQTDSNYAMSFSKIRDSRTAFIETTSKNLKINHGMFIDIFPIDGYNTTKSFALKNKFYAHSLEKAFFVKNRKFLKKVFFLLSGNYRKIRDKRDKLFKKIPYEKAEIVVSYSGAWGEREIMPKSVFGKGTEATFEGISVRVPENYDEYLTRLYKNYMEFPPIEKQVAHHYCEVIDPEKSYLEYIK